MAEKDIIERLDKIIELLEIRNSISTAQTQLKKGTIYFNTDEVFKPATDNTANDERICNCGNHKHGEDTGAWWCPIHGHIF